MDTKKVEETDQNLYDDDDEEEPNVKGPSERERGKAQQTRYTWEELQQIDRHRLKVLGKVELPFLRVLWSWKGTCLDAMYMDPMLFVPIAIYILIRVMAHTKTELPTSVVETLGSTSIDILGGFLSFFLVLFVNQTNSRFFDMYALSRACAGRIQDVAGYASARLPSEQAHRLMRYMNAAHITGYVALNGPYKKKNFFDPYNNKYGMLLPEELAKFDGIIMDGCSDIFKELCTWCQKDLALSLKAGYIDSFEANEMHKRILDLRAHMDGIHDTCFQPPHFFYIHFLCILSLLYLPLFAINNACAVGWDDSHWSMEILNGCVVILQSVFGTSLFEWCSSLL